MSLSLDLALDLFVVAFVFCDYLLRGLLRHIVVLPLQKLDHLSHLLDSLLVQGEILVAGLARIHRDKPLPISRA